MLRDTENRMKETAEKACIEDVLPEFDSEQQWQVLHRSLNPVHRPSVSWRYAAGIAILMGAAALLWILTGRGTESSAVASAQKIQEDATIPREKRKGNQPLAATTPDGNEIKTRRHLMTTGKVRNSTPCPIELCISQTMKCPNKDHEYLTASSTLQPDQTGELKFSENQPIAANCSLSVKEIEIRSPATGEVILLSAASNPATVEEVYRYLTGEKKGAVLAGAFDRDCNNRRNRQNLRLSNTEGHLVIE